MTSPAELRVYRAPFACVAPAWPCALIFFVIGVGITADAGTSYPVMNAVVGTLAILLSLWLAATLATSRLIVTQGGLISWNYLRRRFIAWSDVQSFGVGRSRTMVGWPCVVIHRNDSVQVATNVVAYTAKYPARIASELAAWQRQLAPAAPATI
jgi:hypothetical protein